MAAQLPSPHMLHLQSLPNKTGREQHKEICNQEAQVTLENLEEWKMKDTDMQQVLNSHVEGEMKNNDEGKPAGFAEDGETLPNAPSGNQGATWSKEDQALFFGRSLPSYLILWRQALGKDNDFATRFKIAQSLFVGDNLKVVQTRNFLNSEGGKLAVQAVAKSPQLSVPDAEDIEPDEALTRHMSDETAMCFSIFLDNG
ncbi:hypothetical protein M422DRAFT_776718 [Sphaerobolus stellatus SS14]|nr:hypothetical protein M422DRAFT_776718 [Sphaerobolus stellatus SS14]